MSEPSVTRQGELLASELRQRRGWIEDAVKQLELSYDGERVLFPVRDAAGDFIGYARYLPGASNGTKMRVDAGTSRELFPPPEMVENGEGFLWLVEGEPDCVRACSLGLQAVAVPGTAGWRAEWAPRFSGRKVAVCFDADESGRAAAKCAAGDLTACGIEARIVDLDPSRDDGFDLTDFAAKAKTDGERQAACRILEDMAERAPLAPPSIAPLSSEVPPKLRFVRADEFLLRDIPTPEPLLGSRETIVYLARGTFLLVYGDGGDGKSTWSIDAIAHLAAGCDWLEIQVPRRLGIVVIENESAPGLFQRKLQDKAEQWDKDSSWLENVYVFEEPWGRLSLADEESRRQLREFTAVHEIDLVVANPLLDVGGPGAGKPEDTSAFVGWLKELGLWNGGPAYWLLHHENKAGQVSGDWKRQPDTIASLSREGDLDRTRLTWEKLRWSNHPPEGWRKKQLLDWVTSHKGYQVSDIDVGAASTSDAELYSRLDEYLERNPGASTTTCTERVTGNEKRLSSLLKAGAASGRYASEPGLRGATLYSLASAEPSHPRLDLSVDQGGSR